MSKIEIKISDQILKEIKQRLSFLNNVGLGYLTLDRSAITLSGGEAQRIRLATQIGSQLMGVLYVLDEPSIGLHPRDNNRLLNTLKSLRDIGNTIIVVEHVMSFLLSVATKIMVMHHGQKIFEGNPNEFMTNKEVISIYLGEKTARKLANETI